MDVRFATPQDENIIKSMWKYCFDDKDDFISIYFKEKYKPYNTLVADRDSRILSSIQLLLHKMSFYGTTVDITYLVGAATFPEARGEGHMKVLLQKSIEVIRQRENMFCILLPFNYNFYRRYGWETCFYHKYYEIPIQSLQSLIQKYGRLEVVDFNNDTYLLSKIYDTFISDKTCVLQRTHDDWKCILADYLTDGAYGYFIKNDRENYEGYIIYSIKNRKFNVYEMCYTNVASYKGLLWFVYSHSSQADDLIWNAPPDDMAYVYIKQPRYGVKLKPFVMARAVNVLQILKFFCSQDEKIPDIIIKVEDKLAKWNDGTYFISNGKVVKNDLMKYELYCDIGVFTQLCMGAISPMQAYRVGALQSSSIYSVNKMSKIFKLSNNYINDYY